MGSATSVVKRRFDLSADWRLAGSPGQRGLPILDETGAYLTDERGTAFIYVLLDEAYFAGPGEAKDLLVYRRVFDLSVDARD